eukprot:TRINITY_DN35573_c0_g1_i1.p1 TRINITY_DN35573_c0_g1~~TRINITY_DN35573_c0_g1_i1.p1  ORF type:complete len:486 (+),score=142.92 TRINITY_DN35573_c0_g1_i1:56-1459(+)
MEGADKTCVICLEPWATSGNHRAVSLPCGHIFGLACIQKWLSRTPHCCDCKRPCSAQDLRSLRFSSPSGLDAAALKQSVQCSERQVAYLKQVLQLQHKALNQVQHRTNRTVERVLASRLQLLRSEAILAAPDERLFCVRTAHFADGVLSADSKCTAVVDQAAGPPSIAVVCGGKPYVCADGVVPLGGELTSDVASVSAVGDWLAVVCSDGAAALYCARTKQRLLRVPGAAATAAVAMKGPSDAPVLITASASGLTAHHQSRKSRVVAAPGQTLGRRCLQLAVAGPDVVVCLLEGGGAAVTRVHLAAKRVAAAAMQMLHSSSLPGFMASCRERRQVVVAEVSGDDAVLHRFSFRGRDLLPPPTTAKWPGGGATLGAAGICAFPLVKQGQKRALDGAEPTGHAEAALNFWVMTADAAGSHAVTLRDPAMPHRVRYRKPLSGAPRALVAGADAGAACVCTDSDVVCFRSI